MKKKTAQAMDNPYIVPALERGLKLIEFLSRYPYGVTVQEMEPLNVPPASLFRMLTTLLENGYIVKERNSFFRLTGKLLRLAAQGFDGNALIPLSINPLRALRDKTGESAMLGILHGEEGVVLYQEPSGQAVKVVLEIGHHFPLHSSAPAKAIMANLPEDRADELIRHITFTPFTAATIDNEQAFRNELQNVRQNGFAFDVGEEMEDLHCIATPILDRSGFACAAVWISGPASRMSPGMMKRNSQAVMDTAKEITGNLIGKD